MRIIPTILLALGAIFLLGNVQSAVAGGTNCVRTEQRGCIEFDLLNLQYDPTHPLVKKIPASGRANNPSAYISTKWGQDLYKSYKRGELEAAGAQTFCICVWSPAGRLETSRMSVYVLHGRRHQHTRHAVRSVSPNETCPTVSGRGRADWAFRISIGAGKAVAAFQMPWDMIDGDTLILTGTVGKAVYPKHGAGSGDGFWHTPKALASAKRRGWSYWLRPTFQN